VANKGRVRGEGTAGRLLTMARPGSEDGSARPACPREEDKVGAHTSASEERGRPGGPAGW
jgi:hypothetical protein